jgi:hypothetical protein
MSLVKLGRERFAIAEFDVRSMEFKLMLLMGGMISPSEEELGMFW